MSAATVTLARRIQERQDGVGVKAADVLDAVERLHLAAGHPDIKVIRRYGQGTDQSPAGVAITYQSGSEAYLWAAAPSKTAPEPADLPAEMPDRKFRAQHALKFLLDLLDTAKPAMFTAWRPVAFAGAHLKPSGLAIACTDGTIAYLRGTAGFGGNADLDRQEYPDYTIPATVGV